MSTQVQRRKGTTVQHSTFTGASAELTVDTTKNTVVVHDGATAGGIPLAKETGSAISATSLTSSGASVISVTNNTNAALRITQLGTGNALLVEDSTNPDATPFVVNNSGQVIVGDTSTYTSGGVTASLQVTGTTADTGAIAINSFRNSANGAFLSFAHSKSGVNGTQTTLVQNDTVGLIRFSGSDGTAFIQAAAIESFVDGTPGTNDMPGRLVFSTTADGASSPTERMRIASNGDISIAGGTANGVTYLNASKVLTSGTALTFDGTNLGIGTTSPGAKLDVNGQIYCRDTNGIATDRISPYAGLGLSLVAGSQPMLFTVNSAERMRLDISGNLGIGTTSPAAKLHVSGSLRAGSATDYVQLTQYNTNLFGWLCGPAGDYAIRLNTATANVGIGADPNASAALDVQSTTKGVRMPNMTTTQKNAIASPAAGLMVFDTTLAKLCVYTGAAWQTITSV